MKYIDFLQSAKDDIQSRIDSLLVNYKVEPVGYGYIDCIVMKDLMDEFINEISNVGVLVPYASWWCYVNPNEQNTGCPHGMGGPVSDYYEGWFSELQNDLFSLDENDINLALEHYDEKLIIELNKKTCAGIKKMLEIPFKYTPNDFINENKCVTPALWLEVPDDWRNSCPV